MSPLYRDVVEILKRYGCEFKRQGKGDHEIWWSPLTDRKFTIDRGGKSRHTFNSALKTAGIEERV